MLHKVHWVFAVIQFLKGSLLLAEPYSWPEVLDPCRPKSNRKGGQRYVYPIQALFDEAPQIRVRNLSDRQMEQLGELVVANERLAGRPVSKARQRVEFLKRRREVWEQIYNYFTKEQAAATLSTLEEANRQVCISKLYC